MLGWTLIETGVVVEIGVAAACAVCGAVETGSAEGVTGLAVDIGIV